MPTAYRKYDKHLLFLIAALWVIGYVFLVGRATEHQENRKQVEAADKARDRVKTEQGTKERDLVPKLPSDKKTTEGSNEAPEVAFLWLKLGEALLIFVTLGLRAGTKAIFFWGRLEYVDAFGHDRWFEFRTRNSRTSVTPNGWGLEPWGGENGN